MTSKDMRPDGFVHVWDYPDDPNEPCWDDAAKMAIAYVSGILGLDPETDFKIECQSVDSKEEYEDFPEAYIGFNVILISHEKFLASENKKISIRNLGFIIDGFLTGWLGAHSTPITIKDVHTEHCSKFTCKYGEKDCTVTTGKAPASYEDVDSNPMHSFGQGRGD
jgi:hypothetical protein